MPKSRVLPGAKPFWMLNDASTVDEKLDFLHRCHAGGIEALTLHSRSGNLIPYGSNEWFEMVRSLVLEAERLGMEIWLYDEDPFPSGAAGGMVMAEHPELLAKALQPHELPDDLTTGDLWTICPHRVIWAGLVPTCDGLEAINLTGEVGSIRVDWFMEEWDSRYLYADTPIFPCPRGNTVGLRYAMHVPEVPDGYKLVAYEEIVTAEDSAWNGLPDLLQFKTFDVFRKLSLDKYTAYVGEFYGKTIPGIFTDEPKYYGVWPVTPGMFEDFRKKYGYDLLGKLYQLFGDVLNAEWEKTRIDYRNWLGQRFLAAFLRPYANWCETHHLHLVGHLSPEDDQICEAVTLTSHMPILKTMAFPGTDIIVPFVGDRESVSLNLGSLRCGSVRSQQGKRYTASETLALTDWDVTTRLSRQILGWQKVLGIDRFYFHGFFNTNDGVSLYEAPPDYGPNNSLFRGICVMNDWMKRTESLMDGNIEEAPVAVLNSMASFLQASDYAGTEHLQHLRACIGNLLVDLLKAHVGLHLVDDADMGMADVGPGSFTIGQRAYEVLVVPRIDVIPHQALQTIGDAAREGCRVVWCGGGPARFIDKDDELQPIAQLPGEVLSEDWPGESWCASELPVAMELSGPASADTYVRRFVAEDSHTYAFLACLQRATDNHLLLPRENDGRCWVPVDTDGTAQLTSDGTQWDSPAYSLGLFRLDDPPNFPADKAWEVVGPTGQERQFERLEANVLRLQAVTATRPDRESQTLAFPKPYWALYDDYRSTSEQQTFSRPIPVTSTPFQSKMGYQFAFDCQDELAGTELVVDPRCGRGLADVVLDGELVYGGLKLPFTHITPQRIALPALAAGNHVLELRFTLVSAMDGLMTQLYLEGDFHLNVDGDVPVLSACKDVSSVQTGWPDAGLPHYMGDGRYQWSHTFSADDLARSWALRIDDIMDAGELTVNGVSLGGCAWQPYQWELNGLVEGENSFELVVSSTAGNRFKLDYPRQAQGWLGKAVLLAR